MNQVLGPGTAPHSGSGPADQASIHANGLLALLTQYQTPAILMAAHSLGIFSELGHDVLALDELAHRLGLPERSLGILVRACVALGLLTLIDGRYATTPLTRGTLVNAEPGYLGRLVEKETTFYEAWANLDRCVREDAPALAPIRERARRDPEATLAFLLALDDIAQIFGVDFVERLDLVGCRSLLDVGGGVGSYAVRLAHRFPEMQVTLLELPEVAPWSREFIGAAGLTDQIRVIPADFLTDEFTRGHEVILFSNVFHDHPPPVCQELLAKAFRSLERGDRVVIYDFLLGPDRVQPTVSAVFAVMMLVENLGGNVYSEQEVKAWLKGAGFKQIELARSPDPSPMGWYVGIK
ncbi:MAG TPA: methyltransferase [Anaerolineales bacterium]|nr:methyltransferase [Anaerolineales bacterium]